MKKGEKRSAQTRADRREKETHLILGPYPAKGSSSTIIHQKKKRRRRKLDWGGSGRIDEEKQLVFTLLLLLCKKKKKLILSQGKRGKSLRTSARSKEGEGRRDDGEGPLYSLLAKTQSVFNF